jgi:hypothetical protein
VTFDAQLRTALQAIHAKPTPKEASAIIDVARLAAAADKKTDLSEVVVLLSLSKIVCEMAGVTEMPNPSGTIDPKRLAEIGESLVQPAARELAYASAFLIMIQDLDLTKEESALAAGLADALVIEAARAKQLAAQMETLVRSARK